MRIIFLTISFCTMTLNLLLGYNYFFNDYQQLPVSLPEQEIKNSNIKIVLRVANNLPLITKIKFNQQYYFSTQKGPVSTISLINSLNLSHKYFNLLSLDLSLQFEIDTIITLEPTPLAIQFYHRFNLTLTPLLAIGLKMDDAQQILTVFHNQYLTRNEIIEILKSILLTSKRKYLSIINQFVVY